MKTSDRELLESLERKLDLLSERLEKNGLFAEAEEITPETGEAFERRMNLFIMSMNALFVFFTWFFYNHVPAFFPVSFGLLFVFLILAVGLAIDEYLLPTKTFRRISTNALAVSVFWFSVIFLAVSGVRIGMSIISDPFGGEEGRRSQPAPVTRDAPRPPDSALYGSAGAMAPATTTTGLPPASAKDAALQKCCGKSEREQ